MIPKSLKIQNFLSHDVSEIDFDKFDVALILGTYNDESDQSNGAGKSTIFEAISWALFGKSRHKKIDGVVKWDRRACRVEFSFLVEDILYRITRTRDKIIRDSDVVFEQWDGTKFQGIECDTNTATDRKIVSIINVNYEVFVNSVYFKQDDISMFATTTPSKRKDVLKALLKMDKWDSYQKKAKERAKIISSKIEEKSQHLVPMIELDEELVTCKSSISNLKKQIKEYNKEYVKLNNALISEKSQYQITYNDTDGASNKLKQLQREALNTKKRIAKICIDREENNKIINRNTNQSSSFRQSISVFKDEIKAKNRENLDKFRSNIVTGRTKEKLLSAQINALKQEIKLAGKCDLCKTPLTKNKIIEIKNERKKELDKVQQEYSDTRKKLARANSVLKSKEEIVKIGNKAEINKSKTEVKIAKLRNEIDNCIDLNERFNEEQALLESKDFSEEISNLKLKSNKDSEEELRNKIASLEQSLKNIKSKGDRANVEYGSKIRRRNEITTLQKTQAELQKEINKLNSEFVVYDKLRGYFGREGVQSVIIENVIEELENYSNDTLAKICNEPTSISIKTQKQNEKGSWTETFDISVKAGARTDDFDTFSGGEKFRISLALRLALSNILSKRMGGIIKFLLLDEVSSNLDNKGLEMFIDIVKQLSSDLKILVITHNERLKERFEDVIMVNKGPTGSSVSLQ
jgi:exonuclease SbcC